MNKLLKAIYVFVCLSFIIPLFGQGPFIALRTLGRTLTKVKLPKSIKPLPSYGDDIYRIDYHAIVKAESHYGGTRLHIYDLEHPITVEESVTSIFEKAKEDKYDFFSRNHGRDFFNTAHLYGITNTRWVSKGGDVTDAYKNKKSSMKRLKTFEGGKVYQDCIILKERNCPEEARNLAIAYISTRNKKRLFKKLDIQTKMLLTDNGELYRDYDHLVQRYNYDCDCKN